MMDMIRKAGRGVKAYLSDWRNWLIHGVVGVILAYAIFFAPIAWYYRLGIFVCVVIFNVIRMRYEN